MVLYELVLITRIQTGKATSNLLKSIATKILEEGGNVREMKVLGDRVLTKAARGVDYKQHIVGRYL